MPGHDLIVIGASAGGIQAVTEVLRGLPADLPAAILVVLHTGANSPGILPHIYARSCAMPVEVASDGQTIRHGHVYVPPPDLHMLVKGSKIVLTRGPKENGFRPAVDPLFRTAARAYRARVVGVVLSGALDDGTEGLMIVKHHMGIAIAQDPLEAHFPSMPASAVANVDVDHVLKTVDIPPLLVRLSRQAVSEGVRVVRKELDDPAEVGERSLKTDDFGPPSALTCPECSGALWELKQGKLVKYQCHVGHSYTTQGLVDGQARALEAALWVALRSLEESAELRRKLARRSGDKWPAIARRYERQAAAAEQRADVIRSVLLSDGNGHKKNGAKAGRKRPARRSKSRRSSTSA